MYKFKKKNTGMEKLKRKKNQNWIKFFIYILCLLMCVRILWNKIFKSKEQGNNDGKFFYKNSILRIGTGNWVGNSGLNS